MTSYLVKEAERFEVDVHMGMEGFRSLLHLYSCRVDLN